MLNLDTPVGRKFARQAIERGTPLVRTRQSDLDAAGGGGTYPMSPASRVSGSVSENLATRFRNW